MEGQDVEIVYRWAEGREERLAELAADLIGLPRRAATYVDKILKGALPGDLPIEQPTKLDFIINLQAAQDLGLTIPRRSCSRPPRSSNDVARPPLSP